MEQGDPRIDHERYQSVWSWRYGSPAMRALWSEAEKRRLMRRVWLALAEAQAERGLVTAAQLADLRRTAGDVDIARALAHEAVTRHDVMAEIRAWADQAPQGGAILHLGATSADVTDNVDALRTRDALALIRRALCDAILALAERVEQLADVVTLGWTHLQPAAPTTIGYRLAGALQDLVVDLEQLDACARGLRGKGFKGAVGNAASYAALAGGPEGATAIEEAAMARLGLAAAPVTTQVYPRKQDWLVLNALAGIAASASTFALNVRLMQSPPFGEWSEGFAEGQVGSSAMPWKRNPINAENIGSLGRFVAALPGIAWQNESLSMLERTLDDSANRRIVLAEAFLASDEIVRRLSGLIAALQVEPQAVAATLERFGPFAAAERVLIEAAGRGGHRQALHEAIRGHSLAAWAEVEAGRPNPLSERLAAEPLIAAHLRPEEVRALVAAPERHVGSAPGRARAMAAAARAAASAPGP
jgi:adenylosuccinate lyase